MTAISRERWPLILGLSAAPASIAISEFFLSLAALVQLVRLVRRQTVLRLPRTLWIWLIGAAMQVVLWILSPEPAHGWAEIRHILLLAVVFMVLSGFNRAPELLLAWKGIFASATLSSLVLIGEFFYRLHLYREEIAAGGDTSFYLRSGGLLHHWMVYGTVEIVVVAGLIAFWSAYPHQRRQLWPVVAIHSVAVVLSLTRMAWVSCLLLVMVHMMWRRTKWLLAIPLVVIALYGLAPEAVRSRVRDTLDLRYYSNAERLQMLEVGWKMARDHPWTGVGPGRVEKLYESYVSAGDPIPAYHGHLHNNFIQTLAQFGIPLTVVALVFTVFVFRDLSRTRREASSPDERFLSETAMLAFVGFLFAGLFEYTYGHSLGLIMIAFAVFPALANLPAHTAKGGVPGKLTEAYVKEFYDNGLRALSDTYSHRRWFSSVESRFDYEQTKYALSNALGSCKFARALELGPGDGVWTKLIADKVASLDLLDQSQEMLKRASAALKGLPHIEYHRGNFAEFELPHARYDLMVSVRCFEYITNKDAAVKKLHDGLAPGGTLVLITKSANYVRLNPRQRPLLHTEQIARRDLAALFRKHGLVVDAIYPAVFRWKAGYAVFRFAFTILHKLAVATRGRARIPWLTEMATESYLYIVHRDDKAGRTDSPKVICPGQIVQP